MWCSWKILCHTFFFFFNLRHRVKNTRVEAEAYNQLTNPFQVWPINKVSLWRIDCKQNAAGGCPVDVLFLMACEKLLFVLYARRYCDMLRGSPLQSRSHLHWEGKHIPLQSHTHTQKCSPHSGISPLPPVTTTKAAFRNANGQDFSTPCAVHALCPSLLLVFQLVIHLSRAFLSYLLTNFYLQCQIKVTSLFWIF